jgi:uncharacterized protein (DUF111 family)
MKKSRPGILLTVICKRDRITDCENILFRETTTIGIRRSHQQRRALSREFHTVHLNGQPVRLKFARDEKGNILNVQPEYEDCVAIARSTGQPWREVHEQAKLLWQNHE